MGENEDLFKFLAVVLTIIVGTLLAMFFGHYLHN